MNYPALQSDLKIFSPSILLYLDDFLLSKDMFLFALIAFHNQKIGNPYSNPLASPINLQDQILREFPKTRMVYCEMDPLRDLATHFVWRMMQLKVDQQAYLLKSWCHGVLSFDLRIGGIPESHKASELNVQFFKEIFGSFEQDQKLISKKIAPNKEASAG